MINMVEFETVMSEEKNFGSKNFIEVAKKKAKSETGENEFLAVSRGFVGKDGAKRYTKSIALPVDAEMVDFIAENLKKCLGAESSAPAETTEAPTEETSAETTEEAPVEETPAVEATE
jgi:hypothetical protein